jgi:hypothetical protein
MRHLTPLLRSVSHSACSMRLSTHVDQAQLVRTLVQDIRLRTWWGQLLGMKTASSRHCAKRQGCTPAHRGGQIRPRGQTES